MGTGRYYFYLQVAMGLEEIDRLEDIGRIRNRGEDTAQSPYLNWCVLECAFDTIEALRVGLSFLACEDLVHDIRELSAPSEGKIMAQRLSLLA